MKAFDASSYVWLSPRDTGRMQMAYFRRVIDIDGDVESALLHLFADTHYHLRVNGRFVGYGPLRFYPEYPEYDTHDLVPHLKPGLNVITVQVLYSGTANFHAILNQAGFIAAGDVCIDGGTRHSLATPGDWQCCAAKAFDPTAPKYSFAQPPIQIRDRRIDIADWATDPDAGDDWRAPSVLEDQDAWGELRARSIPLLEYGEVLPQSILDARFHEDTHATYGFRTIGDGAREEHRHGRWRAVTAVWIHSAELQSVPVWCHWGEYFLNGRMVETTGRSGGVMKCQERIFELHEGWNLLVVSFGLVSDTWCFDLAFPHGSDVRIASRRSEDAPPEFAVSRLFEPQSAPSLDSLAALNDWLEVDLGWNVLPAKRHYAMPERAQAWPRFGETLRIDGKRPQAFPVTIPAGRTVSLIVDFGAEQLGRVVCEYDAPEGTVIDAGMGQELHHERPAYDKNELMSSTEREIAAGGPGRMETFFPRGSRYLQITVQGHDAPVTLRKAAMERQWYPHAKDGFFECSDPLLNAIWEAGWNTLRLCSEDVYTDTSWRERTLYGGDALPEFATALVTSGDTDLIRRSVSLFMQSQNPETHWQQSMAPMERTRAPLFDYPLLCLVTLEWHYRLTGESDFAREGYAIYKDAVEHALDSRDERGLLIPFCPPFIDHSKIEKKNGLSGPLNALFSYALASLSRLAREFGEAKDADRYEQLSSEVASAVQEFFWRDDHGRFAEARKQDGTWLGDDVPIASYWPSFFDCTTERQERAILEYFHAVDAETASVEDEPFGGPYCCFYLLGALYRNERAGFAEHYMRRYWGHMIEAGSGTIWEHFTPTKTWTHAWSTAPNFYLSTQTLGVQLGMPEATDLSQVTVAPQSETLEWARGEVPHPRGLVQVEWQVKGDTLEIATRVPEGVACSVKPRGRLAGLKLKHREI